MSVKIYQYTLREFVYLFVWKDADVISHLHSDIISMAFDADEKKKLNNNIRMGLRARSIFFKGVFCPPLE